MNNNIKVIKNSIQPSAFEDCPIEIYSFRLGNHVIYVERNPRTSEIEIYVEDECVKKYSAGEAILNLEKDNLKSIEVKKNGVEYRITASDFEHCFWDVEIILPAPTRDEIKQIIKDMIECRETIAREEIQDDNKEQGKLSNYSNIPNVNPQLGSHEVGNNVSSLSNNTLASNQITSVPLNSQNDKSKKQSDIGISK